MSWHSYSKPVGYIWKIWVPSPEGKSSINTNTGSEDKNVVLCLQSTTCGGTLIYGWSWSSKAGMIPWSSTCHCKGKSKLQSKQNRRKNCNYLSWKVWIKNRILKALNLRIFFLCEKGQHFFSGREKINAALSNYILLSSPTLINISLSGISSNTHLICLANCDSFNTWL